VLGGSILCEYSYQPSAQSASTSTAARLMPKIGVEFGFASCIGETEKVLEGESAVMMGEASVRLSVIGKSGAVAEMSGGGCED
jgi:hypothetical protein